MASHFHNDIVPPRAENDDRWDDLTSRVDGQMSRAEDPLGAHRIARGLVVARPERF